MKKIFRAKTWMVLALTMVQVSPLWADSTGDMMSMLEGMKKQMSQMQRTIDAQNLRLQQLESKKVLETPQPQMQIQPATMSDADFQKSLKDNIGEVIPFLKGAKQGGDFRLRHEYFDYFDKNTDNGATDRSRNRFRIRLRWGFDKDYGDDWKFGFRLATGSTTDQASTNQTLGNPGYFNFKSFNLEKAMVSYSPNGLKDYGIIKGVKIGAGKTDNPFLRYSTPIVWDGDVTPEGAYEQITLQLFSTEENKVNLYNTLGQFVLNENAGNETDAELYGYQSALSWSTYNFNTEKPVEFSGAFSYYQYDGWSQTVTSNTASTSYLRTNSILADNFRIVDLYPEIQFNVGQSPVTLWYNYVENVGNVGSEDVTRALGSDIHDSNDAWGVGLKVGKIKKKGDIDWHYGFYEIGVNAVVAAFNDSDFGGPGGTGHTNRIGHKFGFGYGLTKDITVNWTGFVVRPLHPQTSSSTLGIASSANESVFRSQFDLNYKF